MPRTNCATPLATLRAELDVSLRSDDLPPQARRILASDSEEVERMSRTVENLLTLARIDEGRLELLLRPIGLRAVVQAVVTGTGTSRPRQRNSHRGDRGGSGRHR